ncbi:ras-like GTP-binding protein RhoL [Phymastichus coffea]|uniref:ras-like GTP-binding protein RhoL n=1 Tax=Phymastichus coffea TaxID=108790 RepID=UPI00273CE6A5|nr:ras-like GTP-binding protein RhoL [Phymastichus coffea]XP_058805064.1 ras-like GTP-binding protein RhoL [Phymastichus coffea]
MGTGSATKDKATSRLRPIKITAVGDGMVGKTCMLVTYTDKKFPMEYIPTVFENYPKTIEVDGRGYDVTLWDTAGQEDYERLRPLSYPNTDCFLLCFSISARSSYENIASKWYPELKIHCPNIPIILIGTKGDLRTEEADIITPHECKKMKKKIKAFKYLECSAKMQEGLDEVFTEAVRAVLKRPTTRKLCCMM